MGGRIKSESPGGCPRNRQSSKDLLANLPADGAERCARLCERIGVTDQPRRGMERRHYWARDCRQLEATPLIGLLILVCPLKSGPP